MCIDYTAESGRTGAIPVCSSAASSTPAHLFTTTPAQLVESLAVWVYRSDRFAFTGGGYNGWDITYGFTTLQGLVDRLASSGHALRKISKLGICAHGDTSGSVQISLTLSRPGISPGDVRVENGLTADNVDYPDIILRLSQLENFLNASAQVIFFSCIAGQGANGTRLLSRLSRLWQNRTIIGFTTYGYIDTTFGAANAPGNVYDTEQLGDSLARSAADQYRRGIIHLSRMDENNNTAKWVRNNNVIRIPGIDE
ncbi:MAG: hypothetical protein ABI280_10505 [Ginsengibacter sp.]